MKHLLAILDFLVTPIVICVPSDSRYWPTVITLLAFNITVLIFHFS